MRVLAITSSLLLVACETSSQPPEPVFFVSPKTAVVVFGTDADTTLNGNVIDDGVVPALKLLNYDLVALSLPCHEKPEDIDTGLRCWRAALESGDSDLFNRYCRELSRRLTAEGITNVLAVAQSRGAYVAVSCAATDFRFSNLVLLKPVTNLGRLAEFDGYRVPSVLALDQYRFALLGRPTHILIGSSDERVGTDAALAFAALIGAEIEIALTAGHYLPDNGQTTQWVLERLKRP